LSIPLNAYLLVGAILFSLGTLGVLMRRSVLIVFISIELMLQGVNLTFAAYGAFLEDMAGSMFVVISLTVAAAEAAVGLAILVALGRRVTEFYVDRLDTLRW